MLYLYVRQNINRKMFLIYLIEFLFIKYLHSRMFNNNYKLLIINSFKFKGDLIKYYFNLNLYI